LSSLIFGWERFAYLADSQKASYFPHRTKQGKLLNLQRNNAGTGEKPMMPAALPPHLTEPARRCGVRAIRSS
jgi:hypothetical protein